MNAKVQLQIRRLVISAGSCPARMAVLSLTSVARPIYRNR